MIPGSPRWRHTVGDRALFAAVAPRLERAHRERRQEIIEILAKRHDARELLAHKERLVAHRELHFERSCNRKGKSAARYADGRWRKLQVAYRELAEARMDAERIGAIASGRSA